VRGIPSKCLTNNEVRLSVSEKLADTIFTDHDTEQKFLRFSERVLFEALFRISIICVIQSMLMKVCIECFIPGLACESLYIL